MDIDLFKVKPTLLMVANQAGAPHILMKSSDELPSFILEHGENIESALKDLIYDITQIGKTWFILYPLKTFSREDSVIISYNCFIPEVTKIYNNDYKWISVLSVADRENLDPETVSLIQHSLSKRI